MWDTNRDKIEEFLLKANSFHPTITFKAEISETETIFLDTIVYKGDRFLKESILNVRTSFKPIEIFQYTNVYSCRLPGVTKGFIKEEALRLLRTRGGGVLPYKGLMGTCGQPGYVFRDFCLKHGIEFIIFCLKQDVFS